jgi:hypothetical protein
MYGQAAPASPMTITHAAEAGSAMVFAVTAMAKDVRAATVVPHGKKIPRTLDA